MRERLSLPNWLVQSHPTLYRIWHVAAQAHRYLNEPVTPPDVIMPGQKIAVENELAPRFMRVVLYGCSKLKSGKEKLFSSYSWWTRHFLWTFIQLWTSQSNGFKKQNKTRNNQFFNNFPETFKLPENSFNFGLWTFTSISRECRRIPNIFPRCFEHCDRCREITLNKTRGIQQICKGLQASWLADYIYEINICYGTQAEVTAVGR